MGPPERLGELGSLAFGQAALFPGPLEDECVPSVGTQSSSWGPSSRGGLCPPLWFSGLGLPDGSEVLFKDPITGT